MVPEVDVNSLFTSWLQELYDDANSKGSKTVFGLSKAIGGIKSLEKQIENKKELRKIPHIGDKRVEFLTKKLKKHCDDVGYGYPTGFGLDLNNEVDKGASAGAGTKRKCSENENENDSTQTQKKPKRKYVPAKRSGGYAILRALYDEDRRMKGLTKDEIIRVASKYCDRSFTSNAATNQYYSSWNSIKTLISNDLVTKHGRPVRFRFTESGLKLAKILSKEESIDIEKVKELGKAPISDDSIASRRSSMRVFDPNRSTNESQNTHVLWKDFSIKLLIDNREVRGQNDRTFFSDVLSRKGINVDTRALSLGDITWVAENNQTHEEAILDFIVERKRLDDLVESIKDGRFMEQKHRLGKTGIGNIFYLVEETTGNDLTHFAERIKTSLSIVLVGNKFFVQRTKHSDDTVQFLLNLTREISSFYANETLLVIKPSFLKTQQEYKDLLANYQNEYPDYQCTYMFETFQVMMNKSSFITVKEVYVRMLTCVRGVSVDKALTITKYFPTPKNLIEAYANLPDDLSRKKLLRNCTMNEIGSRAIGPKLSEDVYKVWGKL